MITKVTELPIGKHLSWQEFPVQLRLERRRYQGYNRKDGRGKNGSDQGRERSILLSYLLGFGLLFAGISHVVNGTGNKESPGWARGFSIGAGALAIALSFLVMR